MESEKRGKKKLKTFPKLLQRISQSPQYNQSRQSQSSRGNVYKEMTKNLGYLEILVPYLKILLQNQCFQHKTMELQNEEVMLKNT